MNLTAQTSPRADRVPFARPVRVTPLSGAQPALRLLGGNLSKSGMFLRSPLLLEPGTKVSLSLEAKGQTLPFAEAEVVWQRETAEAHAGAHPGFGVRFTNFLHDRAPELVDTLISRAKPLPEVTPEPVKAEPEREAVVSNEQLEKFAEKPAAFTELSLKDDEPAFVKSGGRLVLDLEKEPEVPEVELDAYDDELPPASAFRTNWSRVLGTAAFALLILVPIVVAIGTWRASSQQETVAPLPSPSADPVAVAAPSEPSDTHVVELAPKPVAAAPEIHEAPVMIPTDDVELARLATDDGSQALKAAVDGPAPRGDMRMLAEAPSPKQAPVAATVKPFVAPKAAPAPTGLAAIAVNQAGVATIAARATGNSLDVNVKLAKGATVKRAFALKSPDRLVIDVAGVSGHSATLAAPKGTGFSTVRVGAQPSGARIVLDLARPAASVKQVGGHVTATLR